MKKHFIISRLREDFQAIQLLRRKRVRLFHEVYLVRRDFPSSIRIYLYRKRAMEPNELLPFGFVPTTHVEIIKALMNKKINLHPRISSVDHQIVQIEFSY